MREDRYVEARQTGTAWGSNKEISTARKASEKKSRASRRTLCLLLPVDGRLSALQVEGGVKQV
jgi:hypothetical protein